MEYFFKLTHIETRESARMETALRSSSSTKMSTSVCGLILILLIAFFGIAMNNTHFDYLEDKRKPGNVKSQKLYETVLKDQYNELQNPLNW